MTRQPSSRPLTWAAAGTLAWLGWRAMQRAHHIELSGRVALVTGGSRGLGLLLARELADHGCRVAICARDAQELERAADELRARGAEVLPVVCDIADAAQVDRMVERVVERFGGLDLLINNAGIIQVGPLDSMTLEDFRRAMDINFMGAVHCTLAALPHLRRSQGARVVNITSIGGKVAVPHLLPYDCAKFALVGFSEGLRSELAGQGVRVTTVVPGLMRTGSPPNAHFKGNHDAEYTWFSLGGATPLTAMSAERAARRIVEAARRGEAEVTLTWQAKTLRLLHDLAPGVTADALGLVNRLLPDNEPGGERQLRGMKLATAASPSAATTLMNRAARRNNEYGGRPEPSPRHAEQAGLDEPGEPRGTGE